MSRALEGVMGPVVTPFDAREEPDLTAFADNLRAHVEVGLHGIVVCGSTGEAAFLDDVERARLTEVARPVVPDDRWLIVGTGAESTRHCVQRCRTAAAAGADAVLVVSPHYYTSAMTDEALEAHFRRVADESPIPVLLYNIPKYAHLRLEPALIARLATHGNIVGMKDSSGDMAYLAQCLEAQGERFTVLTGHGGTFATALELGARGGILAVALFAAELSLEIWRAHGEGRGPAAQWAQQRLAPIAAEIVGRLGVPGVKVAMDRIGLSGGQVRAPLRALPYDDTRLVDRLLREGGVAVPV